MSARRLGLYALAGALAYLGMLIATFPAPWVGHLIEMASERRLLLREPVGTAWDGHARLYARQRSGALIDLGPVRWRASPWPLLGGKLAAELWLGEPAKRTSIEASSGGVSLRDIDVDFPGTLLSGFAPELATLGPGGVVRVRSESVRIERDTLLGLAQIEWRGIRLARAQDLELGSHLARVRGGGGKVDIELATLEGPLQLSGGGSWTRAAGLALAGTAEPRTPAVGAFLRSVCAEYRESRCVFRYSAL